MIHFKPEMTSETERRTKQINQSGMQTNNKHRRTQPARSHVRVQLDLKQHNTQMKNGEMKNKIKARNEN